ncbi:MAG: c-type cytochrome [Vulcanimicrobiaceae bacterium]
MERIGVGENGVFVKPVHRLTLTLILSACLLGAGGLAAAGRPTVAFTAGQSKAGMALYRASCAACHGSYLEGGTGPALTGFGFRVLVRDTKATVGELLRGITQQMPLNAPASLTHRQYTAIMAYLLSKNGYRATGHKLTFAAAQRSLASPVRPTPSLSPMPVPSSPLQFHREVLPGTASPMPHG